MIGLARLDGGLALIALFDVLSSVVEIAVLEHVTARREAIAIAMTQVIGLVVLASLVSIVVL